MWLLRLGDEVPLLASWLIATRMQQFRLVDEVHLLVSWPIATRMLPLLRSPFRRKELVFFLVKKPLVLYYFVAHQSVYMES